MLNSISPILKIGPLFGNVNDIIEENRFPVYSRSKRTYCILISYIILMIS